MGSCFVTAASCACRAGSMHPIAVMAPSVIFSVVPFTVYVPENELHPVDPDNVSFGSNASDAGADADTVFPAAE